MNWKSSLLTFCCVTALFTACKKDEETTTNTNNDTQVQKTLKAGKWQVVASTATLTYNGKDTTADLYAETDECDKDDFILFQDNSKVTVDENTNKCADDSQVETFTWGLLDNDTRIYIIDSNPDTFDIVEMSDAQWKMKQVKKNSSGQPVTYVQTLKNIK